MTKKCTQCGKEFIIPDGAKAFKTCTHCRVISMKGSRNQQQKRKLKTIPRSEGLDEHLRELKEYNKQNHTHLSYGKFMALREEELI